MVAPPSLTLTLRRESLQDVAEIPSAELRLVSAGGAEQRAPLGLHPVVIGSGTDCDMVVTGLGVSRRHCEVALTEDGVRLRDLGSKNGTLIGVVRITEALLPDGMAAQLGHAQLTVSGAGPPVAVPLSRAARFGEALGLSVPMRALFATLERVAPSDEPLLLTGESGTGKELLMRALHEASPRAKGPFGVVDCGGLSSSLIEAELFGHVKGAFTGAANSRVGLLMRANGGTLFLDEIGELPLELQPKLLRALESREIRPVGDTTYRPIDVRVVAATHRDLRALVRAGRFREDLFYRLAVVEARVPALRERKEDIPLLVEGFLSQREPKATLADVPPHALALFQSHAWPGNVRELRNAVARLLLLPHDPLATGSSAAAPAQSPGAGEALIHLPLREARELVVAEFERSYLAAQLRKHGSTPAAARAMGVSRQLVHRLVQEYGLAGRDE